MKMFFQPVLSRLAGWGILLAMTALSGLSLSAEDFVVDGLAYKKHADGQTVGVTSLIVWEEHFGETNYPGLREANIPETVTYEGVTYTVTAIENSAFASTLTSSFPPLSKVVIPNTVTSIGANAFSNCPYLKSVTFGENVESIGSWAFVQCESLESVDLPVKVTSIGSHTFFMCTGLKSVSIGKNIKCIEADAFVGCLKLENIYCHLTNPAATEIQWEIFDGTPLATCTLHVPIGTKSLYQEHEIWGKFKNIVEDIEPDPDSNSWITLGAGYAVYVGKSFKPNVKTNPADMALTWSSSDESVATVSQDGVIKGESVGIALITAKGDAPGNPTASCQVEVRAQEPGPEPNCDVNGDGVVDVADVSLVIDAILGKK